MDIKSSEKLYSYLGNLHNRYDRITGQLANPEIVKNQRKYKELSKELAYLKPLDKKYLEIKDAFKQLQEAEELYRISEEEEMKELAKDEITTLSGDIKNLQNEIEFLVVANQADDDRNIFLEIRAGAGGNEASLFASDLLRMYTRVAERKGWKAEIISTTYSAVGGIKEIILYVKGTNVNKYLKFESGVHRVQRVPVTESSGRIHTSTVTAAVLAEVDDIEVDINPKDIRVDTYRSSGAGGQHVNKTESAIRITHIPSGIVVSCQDESSQHKNREKAFSVLKARLFEYEKEKQEDDIANDRKSQVGSGARSEKIRTYNYPQNRVTDHRVPGRIFNIETILDGNLDELIKEVSEVWTRKSLEEKFKEMTA